MKKPDICQICLRSDRELKDVDAKLSELHDEMCDYILEPLNSLFCYECAYLLKKVYNFHVRCKNAVVTYKKWKKTKISERKPVHLLYTLLPLNSLGLWTPKNSKVYTFQDDLEPEELNENTPSTDEIKTEPEDSEGLCSQNLLPQELKTYEGVSINFLTLNDDKQSDENNRLFDCDDLKQEAISDIGDSDDDEHINTKAGNKNSDLVLSDHFYNKEKKGEKGLLKRKFLNETDDDLSCDDKEMNLDEDMTNDEGDSISEVDDSDATIIFDTDDTISDKDDEEDTQKSKIKKNVLDKTKTKIIITNSGKNKTVPRKNVSITELMRITVKENRENSKLKKPQYDKESLIAIVEQKLEVANEIKGSDGAALDKQFILKCLNEKVNESTLKALWNSVRGKHYLNLKPSALKMIKSIHDKYKNDDLYESVFDLEYLNTEEKAMAELQRRKTYECYMNAAYKCEICYQGFKSQKPYEIHIKSHEEFPDSVKCKICSVHCKKEKIYVHMKLFHSAVYKCKRCPLITTHRASMINHYEQHQGKQYICELCGASYKSRSTYLCHRGLAHRQVGQHVCTLCGRHFYSELALKTHKTRAHTGHVETEGGEKCWQCDITFATQAGYEEHVRNGHKVLKAARTRVPGSKKWTRTTNKHGKREMTCRVCNTVGVGYGWLKLHFFLKHPSVDMSVVYADKLKHLCDICGQGFAQEITLRNHMNKHSGFRPFACNICSKKFYSKVCLRSHRLIHFPKSQKCPHCGKMFRTSTHLGLHIRSHTQEKRYSCNVCEKDFLHRSSLNEHIRGVHHNERRVRKKRVTGSGAKKAPSYSEDNSE